MNCTLSYLPGIVLVELLISEVWHGTDNPDTFPLEGRGIVDDERPETLSDYLTTGIWMQDERLQRRSMAAGGWASDGDARNRAKTLADVAVMCTSGQSTRQTPAQGLKRR